MDKALIVKEKWLNLILDGDESGPKLWEIRGSGTWIRGRVGLIQSGSGLIMGSTEIVGSSLLLREDFEMFRHLHKIDGAFDDLPYKEPASARSGNLGEFRERSDFEWEKLITERELMN